MLTQCKIEPILFFSPDIKPSKLFIPQESELIELRETIEMLKAQNSAAQAAIQGALNGPDHPPKGMFRNIAIFHPIE